MVVPGDCLTPRFPVVSESSQEKVGILAFEAAAAMSRLVSLHRSLSQPEILRLRSETMRSPGVSYLNSTDQSFLLRLACAEILDDLDGAAAVITRLEKLRRSSSSTKGFSRIYSDLKAGVYEQEKTCFTFSEKKEKRRVKKMEKYIRSTLALRAYLEAAEASDRKLRQLNGREADLEPKRPRLQRLKEESLWGKTSDEVVGVMAPAALFVFTRVCSVFGPFVQGLPTVIALYGVGGSVTFAQVSKLRKFSSGTIVDHRFVPSPMRTAVSSNSCPIFGSWESEGKTKHAGLLRSPRKFLVAAANTVGGSGLAALYAEVIVRAEKMLFLHEDEEENTDGEEDEEVSRCREEIYSMLPSRIRAAVRAKLKGQWRSSDVLGDPHLAKGWRDAAARMLRWLAPVAHDTLQWQAERSVERRRRCDVAPRMLLLQTLHFSDLEKTEAAVVEVLVGLSCARWHQKS